jgi:hypothetical protein
MVPFQIGSFTCDLIWLLAIAGDVIVWKMAGSGTEGSPRIALGELHEKNWRGAKPPDPKNIRKLEPQLISGPTHVSPRVALSTVNRRVNSPNGS